MKHKNIAIFIPHAGCPHACSFCNQKTITAQDTLPHVQDVERICQKAFAEISDRSNTEIAFFGGSFTAIPREYMLELLNAAQPFLGRDGFSGIRISTRPDCIDREGLEILQCYGVTAIELGAQSMCDHVLAANGRGHSAQDVEDACTLIREYGFSLGLQMMVGLYGSTVQDELSTVEQFLRIHPDTVRIYPVVILRGTELARRYEKGSYRLFPFDTAVELCADAMQKFHNCGVPVIKCGLHPSEFVERDMLAGFYHPAFRELCEGRIYQKLLQGCVQNAEKSCLTIAVHPSCISRAAGHKRENLCFFEKMGVTLKLQGDSQLQKYQCEIRE